jgi:sugar phosphate isomerase/epimerase
MHMTRREMLLAAAGAGLARAASAAPHIKMGVAATSYMLKGVRDPLAFLDYCHSLGAAGVQMGLHSLDDEGIRTLRSRAEQYGMWVEAFLNPPRDASAVEPFERSVVAAKAAGAAVARIGFLSGRRYETFDTLESFQEFAARSWRSLTLAEPMARKHKLRLAIENHKDWRIHDLLGILHRISSEWIGSLVDTGNNISLLDDPMAVIEAFAPYAFATHVKDMAVEDYPDGFLLSEVNLGDGFLDMSPILETLTRAHPELHFSLEMITRDPLPIPVLTPKYWATMPDAPARELAATLALVRGHQPKKPLPRITGLTHEQQVKLEDDNVRACLAYARSILHV